MSYRVWPKHQEKASGPHGLSLQGYWGGEMGGPCVQLTGENCDHRTPGYVGMTIDEALVVSAMLAAWAKRKINDEEEGR